MSGSADSGLVAQRSISCSTGRYSSCIQLAFDNGFVSENIIIVGDSAGGGLALAIVLSWGNNMPMPADS